MQDKDRYRMLHMLEAAEEAQLFMKDISRESLPNDRKTVQAVIRCLEIIGEAAANISTKTRQYYPEIPWRSIIGM